MQRREWLEADEVRGDGGGGGVVSAVVEGRRVLPRRGPVKIALAELGGALVSLGAHRQLEVAEGGSLPQVDERLVVLAQHPREDWVPVNERGRGRRSAVSQRGGAGEVVSRE